MCGRANQSLTWSEICAALEIDGVEPPDNMRPNYNAAPTHDVLVCGLRDGQRAVQRMRWGLIPAWASEPPKYATINAMCETIEEKATWKGSLNKKRCVIPFNGFYEWRGPKGAKQPFYIRRRDGKPMLIAGLWAHNAKIDPDGMRSFTIITCPANKAMSELHPRMPVILDPRDVGLWIGPTLWGEEARALLRPCADDVLTAYPVGKAVGSVKNTGPELVEPIGAAAF
ncbi:SOS response-associated peptidase [Hyphococcus sp.]|uniref:SOS response-associated peptidase n=1 Tax=Hyphococcus sp. TaxID=2038636 RepID=UPI0020895559|nr:MAG: DUF159 family protein [Marinicaulis sp.]